MNEHSKYPRLYVTEISPQDKTAILNDGQAHYLKSVLRSNVGDRIRVFNEDVGEWVAVLETLSKKSGTATLEEHIRTPAKPSKSVHLLFPPIKKDRLDFLIEKAVELGVTDLHPVLTARTQISKINADRIQAQIIEAAEQCERLDIPTLHKLADMGKKVAAWTSPPRIVCALERQDGVNELKGGETAFLIGPEGGFDDRERKILLESPNIQAVSLGDNILRAETAALYCLSLANMSN